MADDNVEVLYLQRWDNDRWETLARSTEQQLGLPPPDQTPEPGADRRQGVPEYDWRNLPADATEVAVDVVKAPFTGTRKAVVETAKSFTDLANLVKDETAASGFELPGASPVAAFEIPQTTLEERAAARAESARNPIVPPIVPELPVDNPKTLPGKFVESLSKVAAGMVLLGKLPGVSGLEKLRELGMKGKAAEFLIKDAVTNFALFDPHEERLSNAIEKTPYANEVTAYLAAKPGDTAIEGRLKNALEGVPLGVTVEAAMQGFKTWRAWRNARRALDDEMKAVREAGDQEARQAAGSAADDAVRLLGDPNSKQQVIPRSASMELGTQAGTDINFLAFEKPEDVHTALAELAKVGTGVTMKREHVSAFKELLGKRAKDMTQDQIRAAGELYAASGAKLLEAAQKAVEQETPANLFTLRKMFETHQLILGEMRGEVRTAPRAMTTLGQAAKAPAKSKDAAVEAALRATGGSSAAKQLAIEIAKRKDPKLAKELDEFLRCASKTTAKDGILLASYFSKLSGLATHTANAMGGGFTIAHQIGERALASRVSQVLGHKGGVAIGEATEYFAGAVQGFQEAVVALVKSRESGLAPDVAAALAARGSVEAATTPPIQNGFLRLLAAGIELPSDWMRQADEIMKMANYRGEARALALRAAQAEAEAGMVMVGGVAARAERILQEQAPEMIDAVVNQTLKATLASSPDEMLFNAAKGLQDLEFSIGDLDIPIGRLLMPFVKTPVNIFTYALERSPAYAISKSFRADVAAGGAREALAIAKVTLGSMVMATAADWAMAGRISGAGPADPRKRALLERMGWRPYSVRVGDTWVAYGRLEPFGLSLSVAADWTETALAAGKDNEAELEELGAWAVMSFAGDVFSKTWMTKTTEFIAAMKSATSKSADAKPLKAITEIFAGFVPAGLGTASTAINSATGEHKARVADGFFNKVKSRIPGLSAELPARHDLWGREIDLRSPWAREDGTSAQVFGIAWDAVMPVTMSQHKPEPIDEALLALEYYPGMPSKKLNYGDGEILDLDDEPALYEEYVQLCGSGAKIDGKGCLERLNELVKSEEYARAGKRGDGPKGPQADMIHEWIEDYRDSARDELLERHPELRARLAVAAQAVE